MSFRRLKVVSPFLVVPVLCDCSGLPPFKAVGTADNLAPVAPKVAQLIANLKCELNIAVNSQYPLTYYEDDPSLMTHQQKSMESKNPDDGLINPPASRKFNLQNFFGEIQYVGDAEFTLDVVDTGSFSPGFSYSHPYHAMSGMLPATGYLLSAGIQYSDAGHRYIEVFQSIDFNRLVPVAYASPDIAKAGLASEEHCDSKNPSKYQDSDLEGELGMYETIATGVMAAAMNDLNIEPSGPTKAEGDTPPALPVVLPNATQFNFGVISAQIDFTVQEVLGAGPTWTLDTKKIGPSSGGGGGMGGGSGGGSGGGGGGGGNMFGLNRQLKDTLNITFIPVCLRHPYDYHVNPATKKKEISPRPIVGSPWWLNFLHTCDSLAANGNLDAVVADRLNVARSLNLINTSVLHLPGQ